MENAKQELNRKRPCKKSSDTTELRRVAIRAKEAGVDDRALRDLARLIKTACSEMRPNQCITQCREIECADQSHVGLRRRLESMIQECASSGGYDSLVQEAAGLSTKMRVEILLQSEEENSKPSESETNGLVDSQIEVLVLSRRVETLEKAIKTAKGKDVNANEKLIKTSIEKLKKLKAKLVNANEKEEERLKEEEKARLKAMKKGKKGKKKGKKKKKK
jgi:hypothetical protein